MHTRIACRVFELQSVWRSVLLRVLWAGCHFSSKAQRRMQVLCCKVGCRWGQAQLPPHAPGTLPNAQPTRHSSGDVGEKGKNHLWMTKDHTESWPEKGKGWL